MSRNFVATSAVAAICVLAGGLAGCGKLGSLERPGPMFGAAGTTAQPASRQDPNRPVRTIDPRDENRIPGQDQPTPPVPADPADPAPGPAPQ